MALISTGIQAGGQVLSNIGSRKREAEYKALAEGQQKQFDRARDAIANIDFSPGSGIYELEQQRKMQAELLGSEADRRGDEREARALAALQDSPRQMQAIAPRIISQSEDAAQKADLQVGQMKVDATKATTAAEQAAEDQARKRDLMLNQLDMQRAGKSFDTYTEGAYGERAARVEGNRALLSEIAETGIAALPYMKSNQTPGTASTEETPLTTEETPLSRSGFNLDFGEPEAGTFSPAGSGYNLDFGQPATGTFSPVTSPEDLESFNINPQSGRPYEFDDYLFEDYALGGYIAKDGGLTKGEYSHETNKKAIIDEEDGRKEGEMTGGEFVLPPYFVAKMEDLIKQGKYEEAGKMYQEFTSAPRFQEA